MSSAPWSCFASMPVLPIASRDEYEAETQSSSNQKLCVVEFTMQGCNASKRMHSELEQLDATYKGTICLYRVHAACAAPVALRLTLQHRARRSTWTRRRTSQESVE